MALTQKVVYRQGRQTRWWGDIKLYKRYIDDIFAALEGTPEQIARLRKVIEARLNKLDEQGGSVRVDPAAHMHH
jgi:hypothetical protein